MKSVTLIVVALCVATPACTDPLEDDLIRGMKLDVEKTIGIVVRKEVRKFDGNRRHTLSRQGKPYNVLAIDHGDEKTVSVEEYLDVPLAVFERVEVGTRLPVSMVRTYAELVQISGKVIDKVPDPATDTWYVVIDLPTGIKEVVKVHKDAYYSVDIGARLPLVKGE